MTETSDEATAEKRAGELREQIAFHRKLYYVDNDPELSDAEYDRLEHELLAIETEYPQLQTPDSPSLPSSRSISRRCSRSRRSRIGSTLAFPAFAYGEMWRFRR